MRSETLYLWGLEPDPKRALHAPRGGHYAVEVCWITDGVVTCRTYQVSAANEVHAARIACQRACEFLSERTTRIEAVDIEQIPRGGGHE